ncbi:MAG: hypothetical protein H6626_06090 [Pseudobdellovibrionaceae bacterium]|nr:MAG: hypothetical protein H6626_06090 [Pseudobdellovibrionaceae bacterium]
MSLFSWGFANPRALAQEAGALGPALIDELEVSLRQSDSAAPLALDLLARQINEPVNSNTQNDGVYFLRERSAYILYEAFDRGWSIEYLKPEHAQALFQFSVHSQNQSLRYNNVPNYRVRQSVTSFLHNQFSLEELLEVAKVKPWSEAAIYFYTMSESPQLLNRADRFIFKSLLFEKLEQIKREFADNNKNSDPFEYLTLEAENLVKLYVDLLVTASASGVYPSHIFIELRPYIETSALVRSALSHSLVSRVVRPVNEAHHRSFRAMPLFKRVNIYAPWLLKSKTNAWMNQLKQLLVPLSGHNWIKEASHLLENSGLLLTLQSVEQFNESLLPSNDSHSKYLRDMGSWARNVLYQLGYIDDASGNGGGRGGKRCADLLHRQQQEEMTPVPVPVKKK